MVTDIQDNLGTDRITLRYLVRCIVEQSAAISAEQIARRLSSDVETIREALKYWVAKGLVEVLRPVGSAALVEGEDTSNPGRGEYYRWIRPTDADYAWQAGLMRHTPLQRLGNSRPIIF